MSGNFKNVKTLSVYRFGDSVATHNGQGETIYLDPAVAIQYARNLLAAASEMKKCKFTDSKIGTLTVEGNISRFGRD